MKIRASVYPALFLFQLAAGETMPDSDEQLKVKVVDAADHHKNISGAEFILENDKGDIEKISSDEEGVLSFPENTEYLLSQKTAVGGYYLLDEPVQISENITEIQLDPIIFAPDPEDIELRFYDAAHQYISQNQLLAGSTYTVYADSDDPLNVYEKEIVTIPEKKQNVPLAVHFQSARAEQVFIKSEPAEEKNEYRIWLDEGRKEEWLNSRIEMNESGDASISLKPGTYYLTLENTDRKYLLDHSAQNIIVEADQKQTVRFSLKPSQVYIHAFDARTNENVELTLNDGRKEWKTNTWIPLQRGETLSLTFTSAEYQTAQPFKVSMASDACENHEYDLRLEKTSDESKQQAEPIENNPDDAVKNPSEENDSDVSKDADQQSIDQNKEANEEVTPPHEELPVTLYGTISAAVPEGITWSLYEDGAGTQIMLDKDGRSINGYTGSAAVPYGSYYLMTDNVPPGYYPPSHLIPVVLSAPSASVTVPLKKAGLQIQCNYQDESTKDAVLGIYDVDGKMIKKLKAADTVLIEDGIFPGKTYFIKVLNAGGNLHASTDNLKVSIPDYEPAEIPAASIDFYHTVKMRIEAAGQSGRVADVMYAVYEDEEATKPVKDSNNQPVIVKTDQSGKADIDLRAGTYYLKPAGTPDHLYENQNTIKIEVDKENTSVKIEQKEVSILFHLKDSDGNYVPGSSFSLLNEEGETLYEWTTGRQVFQIMDKSLARGGTYILHEKRSAAGYQRLADKTVTIPSDSGEPLTVEMIKEKKNEVFSIMKDTGEKNEIKRTGLLITGAVALAIMIASALFLRKRIHLPARKQLSSILNRKTK